MEQLQQDPKLWKIDIAERRLSGWAIPFKIDGKVVDLRLSHWTATNERIVMRVLNNMGDISLEQFDFEETDLKNLRKAIHEPKG